MLRDPFGRPIVHGIDGWHHLRFLDAIDAAELPGAGSIKRDVDWGLLPRNSPVFVGYKEVGGGYPTVLIALPTDQASAAACMAGDPSVLADLVEALEEALEGFMAQVKSGKLN